MNDQLVRASYMADAIAEYEKWEYYILVTIGETRLLNEAVRR